jgi:hypothetical protein
MGNLIQKDANFKERKEVILHLKKNSLNDLNDCISYI